MASGDISDTSERQQNELEAIMAIYNQDVIDLRKGGGFTWEPPVFSIRVFPQGGSSCGVIQSERDADTSARLRFRFPIRYPNVIPEISIESSKGLTDEEVNELREKLIKVAKDSLGEVMVLNLAQFAEIFLHGHQKGPTGSFYDEMLKRKKILEEESIQVKSDLEKKMKVAIKEEIERKQETLREEVRKRKELQLLLQVESSNLNLATSPTKSFGFTQDAATAKKHAKFRRKNSSKRISEGSESSEHSYCETIILEFSCLKALRSFHRGELLGGSERGSKVYAGMDSKSGTLVAIGEWEFQMLVDRKNRLINNVGDGNTMESLLKQLSLFESEFKLLQKLEHPNLSTYYGMKTIQEDNATVVLYIAQEFLRGTTLQSFLQDNMTLDIDWIRNCANGILQGLEYLHSNNIVHRYLRDTSIFLDHFGDVKMTDYGLERKINELHQNIAGNPEIRDKFAPSIGRGAKKGDIYRFGILILSLVRTKVVSENPPDISTSLPVELQDFLRMCLTTNEHARWSAAQLLEHVFLKLPITRGDHLRIAKTDLVERSNEEIKDADTDNENKSDVQGFVAHVVKGHSRLQHEFEVLIWLGRGAFGDVLKVRNKLDGRVYALKRIRLNPRNKQLNKKITREVKLLSQLNHENVVRYFNSWIETVLDYESEETTDETTATPTSASIYPKDQEAQNKLQQPHVHFNTPEGKGRRNSLDLSDDVEALAAPHQESEWSASVGEKEEADESDDESEGEDDIFGTSFLCLENNDSDDIMFETGSSESEESKKLNGNSLHSGPTSDTSKSRKSDSPPEKSVGNEIQFMYIQMEFCEKSTLRTAIDNGLHLDIERTWRLFREIVEGLTHIHQQGMIHRDLKPVNIFLDLHDNVKIGDFGLATRNIIHQVPEGIDRCDSAKGDYLSTDFTEESHTGQVGTTGYVAPELIQPGAKAMYNQKVDIYSLGIIFFEMVYRPLETTMERVRLISGLRQLEVTFPPDFDEYLFPKQAFITRWLLKHNPSQRPTSAELLQSEFIPPAQMEETELQEVFRYTLSNSQSKAYKYLMSSCFKQAFAPADEITYIPMDTSSFNLKSHTKFLPVVPRVKDILTSVFRCHGGIELLQCPLLSPKSSIYDGIETSVNLMTNSGQVVSLPHDLRVPFARYVVSNSIMNLKRYSIEKVFRERKIFGFHPRELYECAFDIISMSQGSLLADAEVFAIVFEIIGELPWLRDKCCTIQLGHTKLLEAILLHFSIDEKFHNNIRNILADLKAERHSKSQVQTHLVSLCLPDQFITMLFSLLEMEGPLSKVSNILKGIIKKKGEAASLIKEALHELEVLAGHIDTYGFKANMVITPTLVFGSNIYNGLIYQVICDLKRRKSRMVFDVIAAGGRYDSLLQSLRKRLDMSALSSKDLKQYGVGISISLDKLVSGAEGFDFSQDVKGFKSHVDVIICSFGHHSLNREKIGLMKEFWSLGISCVAFDDSESLESAEEQCREVGAPFLIILKESELFGNLRLRCFEKERIYEKKLPRLELIEYVKRNCRNFSEAPNEMIHMTKSEGSKSSSISLESNTSISSSVPNCPTVNITFILIDMKEKNATWRKRNENQMMTRINDILPKLSRQHLVELVGLEVNSSLINLMASYFQVSEKEQYSKSVSDFLENQSRQRKYMKSICDGIYELLFEKNATIIILYGMVDNSYRVIF